MIFDPNSVEYKKWCQTVGISANSMPQKANNALFKCINELLAANKEPVLPAQVENGEGFEAMGVEELKAFIVENGGTYHHASGVVKLTEIARELA